MRLPSFSVALFLGLISTFGTAASASTVYWSLFNVEEESQASAIYVTYGSLSDMLTDSNRTGQFVPDNTGLAAANVVGSGAFWLPEPSPVPLPATGLLLCAAIALLLFARRAVRCHIPA
jgi:hypothetical protein